MSSIMPLSRSVVDSDAPGVVGSACLQGSATEVIPRSETARMTQLLGRYQPNIAKVETRWYREAIDSLQGMDMQANEQEQIIQKYIAAYNAFDVDGMLKLLSHEVRFENWAGAQLTTEASGIDDFRRLAHRAKAMFSEREQRITSLKQIADSIIVSIAYRGQLAVDIPDGPRAGTALNLNGESEFTFKDCLISKIVDRS
jgi:hypothetical protein